MKDTQHILHLQQQRTDLPTAPSTSVSWLMEEERRTRYTVTSVKQDATQLSSDKKVQELVPTELTSSLLNKVRYATEAKSRRHFKARKDLTGILVLSGIWASC